MKYLKSGAICVLLSFSFLTGVAQFDPPTPKTDLNKPKLFTDLEERIKLNVTDLDALLDLPEGQVVNVHLGGSFNYRGSIISRSDASDVSVKSIVIKSINRVGATLTFAKVFDENGSFQYRGRILSLQHGDAFEIQQEQGQYLLVKKSLYDLFNE